MIQFLQSDVETMRIQIGLGQSVRKLPTVSRKNYEKRIYNIVSNYDNYETINQYLEAIGHNLEL